MIIIDDFLSEGEFKDLMTADEHWQNSLRYSWHEGKATEESNHWVQFAYYVWNVTFKPPYEYDGFEYWSNALVAGDRNDLPWHFDKDEHLWSTTNKVLSPTHGLVYYCHKKMPKGGYLEIERGGEMERIQPVPNRLIIFDPSIKHRVTPIHDGVRRTFASNVWMKKPSEENFV
jgi:hypothetical protein